MSEESQHKIIINLHESSNAKEFETRNRIHPIEFERIKRLIDIRIDSASRYKDQDNKKNSRQRNNDTISILGSRGSGKTSFLLSLLKYYKEEAKHKAEVLDIIDPTLIEEKGHVFLTILSLIEEAVCKKIKLSDCSPNDTDYCLKKEWKDKLRKLADGLPSIDGIGLSLNDTNWQDAEFIMDRGLKTVKAAKDLETNLNDLVACALKTLGKEVFIITLDDIDVDFRKGWPVLETIRKYLTSPQIIVLLSGDLKLYSKAIRKQQWKNFGKALLINEADRLHKKYEYNDLVTEMESQYLQKIIKPENRIRLTTLYEKINLYEQKIVLEDTIIPDVEIKPFYNKALAIFGIHNEYQAEAYTSFLLNLPVRTQIQFLGELEELNVSETTNVIDPFLSDLYEKEVDVDLARNLPKMLDAIILKLLIKEQVLSDGYQLQPTTTDASLNGSLTALSFIFSQKVKTNPHLIFDYFIKIGYTRNLLGDINYKNIENGKLDLPYSIEDLCQSSGIYQDKVLRDVTGNITAYVRGILYYSKQNSEKSYAGTIPLLGLNSSAKGNQPNYRIDYEFRNENILRQRIASIPISISSDFSKNSTLVTYSPFMLLATIGELLRKHQNKENVSKGILELSQIRTYLMPKFKDNNNKTTKSLDEKEPQAKFKNDEATIEKPDIDKMLNEWMDRFPLDKIALSPHLLGKISTRFFYATSSIDNNSKSKDLWCNLGDNMYRRIIALINAIIVEDIKENEPENELENEQEVRLTSKDLNLDNVIADNTIFISNLKVANGNKENILLSRWLLSCPLFILYLPNDENLKSAYLDFISSDFRDNEIKPELIFKSSIYTLLQNVVVKEFTGEFDEFIKKNKNATPSLNPPVSTDSNKPKFSSRKPTEKEKVLLTLIEHGISASLFVEKEGKTEKEIRNKEIREKCIELFDEDKIEPDAINKFIDFLESYDGENKEIVEKWKQAQS